MAPKPSPSEGPIVPQRHPDFRPANFQTRQINQTQQPPQRRSFFRSCLIAAIIFLIVVVAGITYVAAASGLVNIPGISKILYQTPQPVREVSAEDLNSEGIKTRVEKEISQGSDRVEVFVTESNLTSIINSSSGDNQRLENPQVAIIDNGQKMEVFGKLINSDIYLTTSYNIGKDFQGNFKIEGISSFKVGNIKVPLMLISWGIISEDSIKNLTSAAVIEDVFSADGIGLKILDISFSEGKIIESVSISADNIDSNSQQNSEPDLDKQSQETTAN